MVSVCGYNENRNRNGDSLKEKPYNNGQWTAARFKGFVTSALRAASSKWPPKYQTLNEAKTEKRINPKSGKLAQHYRCNVCKEEYTSKDVNVDHRSPVVDPSTGFVDWNTFIDRLFCEADNLQVLCSSCHSKKSKLERQKK